MLPITKFSLRAAKSIADHMPFVTDFFMPKAVRHDTSKPTVARPYSRLTWVLVRAPFTTALRPQFYTTALVDAPNTRGKVNVNVLPCPQTVSQRALLIWPSSSCKSSPEFIRSSSSSHSSSTHSASVAMVMATEFLIRR